jgi:hypothetical protein
VKFCLRSRIANPNNHSSNLVVLMTKHRAKDIQAVQQADM